MKTIYLACIVFLLLSFGAQGQRISYGFVDIGQPVSGKSSIVKDTICGDCVYDYDKGYIPTKYNWVRTIFNDPPDDFQIMRWYWSEFPKTYNGWRVEYSRGMEFTGWTEGLLFSQVDVTCDTCDLLDKYTNDIILEYGHNNETILTIRQNKDTTDKYFKLKYP